MPSTADPSRARNHENHRGADDLLRAIYTGKTAWAALATARQEKIRAIYATLKDDEAAGDAWMRLLNHLGHNTPLLSVDPVVPWIGPQAGNTLADGMLMLALRSSAWIRPPEDWLPESDDLNAQLGDLARHLFSRYFVPSFLDAAWFEGFTPEGETHRDWFLHIGGGQNIRRAALPLPLTEKAAHHFLQAPAESSIVGALRYGQVLGLRGSPLLAQAVTESKMGRVLPDESFWFSVLHFFANHPEMPPSRVGPIVDYLLYQKFGELGQPDPERPRLDDAQEPDFTMKGRTLRALQMRVEAWHEALARENKRPRSAWEPSGIGELDCEERDEFGTLNHWRVVELRDSHAMREEGREMHHCVFSYAANCLNGSVSVWSLRVKTAGEGRFRRIVTIEVNMARRAIVQVRGRCNQTLGAMAHKGRMRIASRMLRRWAKEQHLSIACGV